MTALLPDPVPLDPPPGSLRALEDLTGRLRRAADLLGELGERLSADAGSVPAWAGRDADGAVERVRRVHGLAHEAAAALQRAGTRLGVHREVLEDAGRRLAGLREAQEDDFGAAAARMGGIVDPLSPHPDGAIEHLHAAESARRRVAEAIREDVAADAAATAIVLAGCTAVAGGSRGEADVARYLDALLPGWHEARLAARAGVLAVVLRDGDPFDQERAARELLPSAAGGAVAAAVLTGLGVDGFRAVLRRLGDGSLSAGSALARVMAAVLGAPVPPADAAAVARVRDGRHVDAADHRTLDADLVALGMGVVLAAARGSTTAGPPAATVRGWGRQIVARERAMGAERIVDRVRLPPSPSRPGDPLEQVLVRLAGAGDPAAAAGLLRGQPTWSHLLARPWDDDGAALAAVVQQAGQEPGPAGDVAVRSGLRALATGLGDDGDPAAWTVDRATAAAIAPELAGAVALRPDVVAGPLARAAAGEEEPRALLRGLGALSGEPAAATVLDRALDAAAPVAVAGWTAVREYGQRLAHALDGFAAQERAERRMHLTDAVGELASLPPVAGRVLGPLVALGGIAGDLDGTWDEAPDRGRRFSAEDAVRAAGGAPGAGQAYRRTAALLGAPRAPVSPPIDWRGLAADLLPGRGPHGEAVEHASDLAGELLDGDEMTAGVGREGRVSPSG